MCNMSPGLIEMEASVSVHCGTQLCQPQAALFLLQNINNGYIAFRML